MKQELWIDQIGYVSHTKTIFVKAPKTNQERIVCENYEDELVESLFSACQLNDLDLVKYVLNEGAPIHHVFFNDRDPMFMSHVWMGYTPFGVAIKYNASKELLDLLVIYGADIENSFISTLIHPAESQKFCKQHQAKLKAYKKLKAA